MADRPQPSPSRILAPAALVVFAIAFFGVILASQSGDGGGEEGPPAAERPAAGGPEAEDGQPQADADSYTVKTGDTLAGIAEKTGVSVERLQELNPELDPQALVSGQKIRLRE